MLTAEARLLIKKPAEARLLIEKKTTEARSGKDSFLKICFLNIQEESFWRVN
jgi:hypothetical protein